MDKHKKKLKATIEIARNQEWFWRNQGDLNEANMYREAADALESGYISVRQYYNYSDEWAMHVGYNSSRPTMSIVKVMDGKVERKIVVWKW